MRSALMAARVTSYLAKSCRDDLHTKEAERLEKDATKWGHLDIAGPVWDDKKGGATGFAAQTLAAWVAKQGE